MVERLDLRGFGPNAVIALFFRSFYLFAGMPARDNRPGAVYAIEPVAEAASVLLWKTS
jgi:hypothetical protein